MLTALIRKELMVHVLSLRFHLAAALVVVLLGGAAVLQRQEQQRRTADYAASEEVRQAELSRRSGLEAPLFQMFSWYEQEIMARPSPLTFVAEGHERDLPNLVAVHAFRVDGPDTRQRSNPMAVPFDALDWTLIVGVVLSFAAIVLTFDGFAGEREEGTLRLVLANPVPRWMPVVAKAVGAWSILFTAFVVGVLVQLLILAPGGLVALDPGTAVRLLVAIVVAGLYVGFFVLLGLLVSARHASASAALVVCLLVWAMLVVVIPRSAVVLAHSMERVDSRDRVAERSWARVRETTEAYVRLHPKKENEWFSGHWSPGESLDMASLAWAAQQREIDAWRDSWVRQVRRARALSFVSPAALLSAGLERAAGSGLERYTAFMEAARRFRREMEARLRAIYPLDPVDASGTDRSALATVTSVQASPSDLPVFDDRPAPAVQAASKVMPFAVALAVLDLVLLLGAVVSAIRYDVR